MTGRLAAGREAPGRSRGPRRRTRLELARQMGDALHDALDFRRVLEPGAAGAGGRPAAVRRRPASTGRPAWPRRRDRDPATRRVADSRLHLAIAAASGSPSLAAAVADVQLSWTGCSPRSRCIRRNLDHSDAQHTRDRRRDPGRRRRRPPGRRWRSTATAPPSCCAGCSGDLTTNGHAGRPLLDGGATDDAESRRSRSRSSRVAVDSGEIDTVLLAITDMQGRLQGKRLHAPATSSTRWSAHGTEGCNYLLAVDVDMNTVDGLRDVVAGTRGYGDFVMLPDLDTLRRVPWQPGTAMVLADLAWLDGAGDVRRLAAPDPAPPARPARRARPDRVRRHRAGVRASTATPTRTPGGAATAT